MSLSQFLAHAKCIEIEDLVDPQVEITYLLDTLPKVVPLYMVRSTHSLSKQTDHTP